MDGHGDRGTSRVAKVMGLAHSEGTGAMVEDVTYDTKIKPPVLAITVVRKDAVESLKADQVSNLARLFSKALDDADPIPSAYTLEVSTPGAEGAIITEEQWRRAVGKRVRITRSNNHKVEGQLLKIEGDSVIIHLDNGDEEIPFSRIRSARGVVELPKES